MRQFIAAVGVLGTIIFVSGCASVPATPQFSSTDVALAKQNVKIYDVTPPNGTPIEQISATSCEGTTEAATDQLIALASQRGGNGLAQLSCKSEGMSMSCWSSATCTAMALNVVAPPPRVAPPVKRRKPKAK